METTVVTIRGTHCNSCKFLIEDVSRDIKGVKSCYVDFQTGRTSIEHNEDFNLEVFKREIECLGQYKIEINS